MLLRLAQLEARLGRAGAQRPAAARESQTTQAVGAGHDPPLQEQAVPVPAETPDDSPEPALDLEHLRQAWEPAVLAEVERRSIPAASVLREARPVALEGDRLVVEFPASAAFHRNLAEEPKNASLLAEVLHEVTGRHLAIDFAVGEKPAEPDEEEAPDGATTEEEFVSLFKDTFDARELREE
jgi:hypothetical protein